MKGSPDAALARPLTACWSGVITASAMAGSALMPGNGMAAAMIGISVFSASSAVSGTWAISAGTDVLVDEADFGVVDVSVVVGETEDASGVAAAPSAGSLPGVAGLLDWFLGEPGRVPLLPLALLPDCALPPASPFVMALVTWLMVWLKAPCSPASGFGGPLVELPPVEPAVVPEPEVDDEPSDDADDAGDELPDDVEPDDEEPDDEEPDDELCEPDEPDPLLPEEPELPLPDEPEPLPDELELPCEECELPPEEPPEELEPPPSPEPEWGRANAIAALEPPASNMMLTNPDAAVSRRCKVTLSSPPYRLQPPYRTAISARHVCCCVNYKLAEMPRLRPFR